MFFTPAADFDAVLRENYHRAVESGQIAAVNGGASDHWNEATYNRIQEEYIHPFFDKLPVPILLIWAAEDGTVPIARGIKMLEMIPHAELHVFNRARHMVMFDQSEGFNRLISGWAMPKLQ